MQYGRCESETLDGLPCWHSLVNGKPLCNKGATVIETREDTPTLDEHRCSNCDGKLRERGYTLREAMNAKERKDPTVLIPKNTFRKWERLP